MKKVRFESPIQVFTNRMDDLECHSPRPFIDKQMVNHRSDICDGYPRLLVYNSDPVQRYENSNNSPYPVASKTVLDESPDPRYLPSNDLDLSMLDGSPFEPRRPITHTKPDFPSNIQEISKSKFNIPNLPQKVLSSVENIKLPDDATKDIRNNNFFIRRDNLKELNYHNVQPLQDQLKRLSINKENVSLAKQAEMTRLKQVNIPNNKDTQLSPIEPALPDECRCYHCIKVIQNAPFTPSQVRDNAERQLQSMARFCNVKHCECSVQPHHISCQCKQCIHEHILHPPATFQCTKEHYIPEMVDKRTWMLQKHGQCDSNEGLEIERQNKVKEKREPTVADLFKIIKLQNEQLQLLQEKVDKFISASNKNITPPTHNYNTEQVALETTSEQHKISIGVMTSFEMVTTSTVINKEIVTQTNESGHIQCNRSHISIKEVVSKSQQGNSNFLDGLTPLGKAGSVRDINKNELDDPKFSGGPVAQNDNINDDKTLNELSLYNVQVDNAITPLISPEQSLYLDVRDYSDSDSDSDDQSNVGWTYYNKVMTHVNGMLQDSDMPSSASAMYRNTRQQCVQMQIDKTNVSVTKRVKFGDDPLGIQQPHLYAASTDTSLKMNQLAAKYLKCAAPSPSYQVALPKASVPLDMSFATRNYMERHQILQGGKSFPLHSPGVEMPRFLDITALKQQPKFL